MTVVIGTAGHIDHGKTALLQALTGIDADRLPEERRRGMTIDVGYAHLALDDGTEIDFVDVPGHDRLVGNMLVGAGEIDAGMLVIAADDGPRPQTREHLAILDALRIRHAVVAVTKIDLVEEDRVRDVSNDAAALLAGTSLEGASILPVSARTGLGIPELRAALVALRDAVPTVTGPIRLAVDRVFTVRGRGVVVTGSLRGGPLVRGASVRVEPGGQAVRIRELQVHGAAVERAERGRVAANLAGVEGTDVRRGMVLTIGAGVEVTDRLLIDPSPGTARHGERLRLHIGTDQVGAVVSVDPTAGAVALRLERSAAVAVGDRLVLRPVSRDAPPVGGLVLDAATRRLPRRRVSAPRLAALRDAVARGDAAMTAGALVDLRGAVTLTALDASAGALGASVPPDLLRAGPLALANDVAAEISRAAVDAVLAHHAAHPLDLGLPLAALRATIGTALRRAAAVDRSAADGAATALADALVAAGLLAREDDRVRDPRRPAEPSPELSDALARLDAALAGPTPPTLAAAARLADCPPDAVRAALAGGRVIRLTDDVAFPAATLRAFERQAVELASRAPLTPAAFRDAIGSSRKYVMAVLEDLDRRGVLRRTAHGHVLGPRSLEATAR